MSTVEVVRLLGQEERLLTHYGLHDFEELRDDFAILRSANASPYVTYQDVIRRCTIGG